MSALQRAAILEVGKTWAGRHAVLDAPDLELPNQRMCVRIPKGSRGWKVGAMVAYEVSATSEIVTQDMFGNVIRRESWDRPSVSCWLDRDGKVQG